MPKKLSETVIGVVGNGVVGNATGAAYEGHVRSVLYYDRDPSKGTSSVRAVLRADIVFVCLPTPAGADGNLDTSALDSFFNNWSELCDAVVIKSTVPVGYTRKAAKTYEIPGLVHSPEFLTARTATEDAQSPRVNVVGLPGGWTSTVQWVDSPVSQLYIERFPKTSICPLSSDESELMKLALNSFFAVKVAFFNELFRVCVLAGADFESVRNTMVSEGRVSDLHTRVPGPDGLTGFGGACLPKDLDAFRACAAALGVAYTPVTGAAAARNNVVDRRGGK